MNKGDLIMCTNLWDLNSKNKRQFVKEINKINRRLRARQAVVYTIVACMVANHFNKPKTEK